MDRLTLADGRGLRLGNQLAKAGEGTISDVAGAPEWVAKIFHDHLSGLNAKVRKVRAMAAVKPGGAVLADGFVVLAWPEHTVHRDGRVVGFLMRKLDIASTVEIHKLSNPSDREHPNPKGPQWPREASWQHLVNVAANLCAAVDAAHRLGAVIGDFNERNILVAQTTRVTLVDNDSFQFHDPRGSGIYHCDVGRPEFLAPELASVDLASHTRDKSSDLFVLAVHIYQLLLAGNHPFSRGVWTGDGDMPQPLDMAVAGDWAGGNRSRLHVHPAAPKLSMLPENVEGLFERALGSGARRPWERPKPDEWRTALLSMHVARCARNHLHTYPRHNNTCPWCDLAGRQNRPKAIGVAADVHAHLRAATAASAPSPAPPPTIFAPGFPRTPGPPPVPHVPTVARPQKSGSRAPIVVLAILAAVALVTTIFAASCGGGSADPDSHSDWVRSVEIGDLDGMSVIVSGSYDGTVRVRNLNSRTVIRKIDVCDTVYDTAVTQRYGQPIVVAACRDVIKVFDLGTGEQAIPTIDAHDGPIQAVTVSTDPTGRSLIVSGGNDSTIRVWDLETGAATGTEMHGHRNEIYALATGVRDGRTIVVSGSTDESIRLWDLETGTPIGPPLLGHGATVQAVAVTAVGGRTVIVSAGEDHTVRTWDISTGAAVGTQLTHPDEVLSLFVYEQSGVPLAVTGDWNGTIRVWNLDVGEQVGEPMRGHTDGVDALVATTLGDGRAVVVSGSRDATIRIWDLP